MSKPDLAIFDLDNTILNGDSDYSMINYLVHTKVLDDSAAKQNQIFIQDYQRGELDFDAYTSFALSAYIGMTRSEINEYWPPIGRVDNVYGDRNLMCSCPSMSDFKDKD